MRFSFLLLLAASCGLISTVQGAYVSYVDGIALAGQSIWQVPPSSLAAGLCPDTTTQPGACRAATGGPNHVARAQTVCDRDPLCSGVTCNGVNCDLRYFHLTIPSPGWPNFHSYIKQNGVSFRLPSTPYAAFENNYAITGTTAVPAGSIPLCPDTTTQPGSCRAGTGLNAISDAKAYCSRDPACVGISCNGNTQCDARYAPLAPPVPGWPGWKSYVKSEAFASN